MARLSGPWARTLPVFLLFFIFPGTGFYVSRLLVFLISRSAGVGVRLKSVEIYSVCPLSKEEEADSAHPPSEGNQNEKGGSLPYLRD